MLLHSFLLLTVAQFHRLVLRPKRMQELTQPTVQRERRNAQAYPRICQELMLDPGDLTFRLNSPGSSEEEYAIIQELLEHKE